MLLDLLTQADAWFRGLRYPWLDLVAVSCLVGALTLLARDILRWYIEKRVQEVAFFLLDSPRIQLQLRRTILPDESWMERFELLQDQHQARVRDIETEFLEEMRSNLRSLIVEARQDGIPLQVTVTNQREADLLRETVGQVPVRVSSRPRGRRQPEVLTPPPSTGEPLSIWERLATDEPEEPCPTSETTSPLPQPSPPPLSKKKAKT